MADGMVVMRYRPGFVEVELPIGVETLVTLLDGLPKSAKLQYRDDGRAFHVTWEPLNRETPRFGVIAQADPVDEEVEGES
jgi:hypothetical protein